MEIRETLGAGHRWDINGRGRVHVEAEGKADLAGRITRIQRLEQ